MKLQGRRVQIVGSMGENTAVEERVFAHELVKNLVMAILAEGGGFVIDIEPEPPGISGKTLDQRTRFSWTILEAVIDATNAATSASSVAENAKMGPPPPIHVDPRVRIKSTTWHRDEVPDERQRMLKDCDPKIVRGTYESSESASDGDAIERLRSQQAQLGDVLITVGGGGGTERAAALYQRLKKPVVPLALQLGSSNKEDRASGTRTGGARLAEYAVHDPLNYFGAELALQYQGLIRRRINSKTPAKPLNEFVADIIRFLGWLPNQNAFVIRALDPRTPNFQL